MADGMIDPWSGSGYTGVMPAWLWNLLSGGAGKWDTPTGVSPYASGTSQSDSGINVIRETPVMAPWAETFFSTMSDILTDSMKNMKGEAGKNLFSESLNVHPFAWANQPQQQTLPTAVAPPAISSTGTPPIVPDYSKISNIQAGLTGIRAPLGMNLNPFGNSTGIRQPM